jgi:ribose transport system permease protein
MASTSYTPASRRWQDILHIAARRQRNVLIIWGILVSLIIIANFLTPNFFTPFNLGNVIQQSGALLLVSLGQTFVLLTGNIDISVGSTISMVVTLLAATMSKTPTTGDLALGIVMALAAGALVGLANGLLVTRLRLSAFMVTLAMQSVVLGIAYALRKQPPATLPRDFSPVFLGNIPLPFPIFGVTAISIPILVMIGATVIIAIILRHTRFGRHVYAVGSNETATRLSGMATDRIKVMVFVACGLMAGLSGAFVAARSRAGDPLIGQYIAFDSITAVILGGTALSGGRGSAFGTLAGVLIIAILSNLLNLKDVPSNWQYVLKGLLLVVAVMLYRKN